MPSTKKINDFIINDIENQEVYDWMQSKGLVNDDELYLIGEEDDGTNIPTLDLGDIRSNPTCLDNIFEFGIYTFTGGENYPADPTGGCKWSLRVYSSEDHMSSEQIAEKINFTVNRVKYVRNYIEGSGWTNFIKDSGFTELEKDTLSEEIEDTTKWNTKKHDESDIAHHYTLERKHKVITVSLPSDKWEDNQQTVEVDGVTDSNTIIVDSSDDVYSEAGVYCSTQNLSRVYVADDAQELYPYGVFETQESIENTVNHNSMSYDIRKDVDNDYITGLYDVDHRVQHNTKLSLDVGTTYYFRFMMRLNDAATVDKNIMRVYIRLNDDTDICPFTANEIEWINDEAGVPTFYICKKGYDVSQNTYLASGNVDSDGWRTIEFEYTPTASDIALGNELKIRYQKGPSSAFQHPFDIKCLFVGTDRENNMLTGVDFSLPVDLGGLFDTEQTLVQESYLHCSYDNDTPVVITPFDITLEADATYQASIRTKLHDSSDIDVNNIRYKFMSGGNTLASKLLGPYEPVVMNVSKDDKYNLNAIIAMDTGSCSYTTIDNEPVADLSYYTSGSSGWSTSHYPYYAMWKFSDLSNFTSSHKYVRVKYRTDCATSYGVDFVNNAAGNGPILISDTSEGYNEWAVSAPVDISSLIERLMTPSHCTFTWNNTIPGYHLYVKEIVFFTTLQQAYEYYGEEVPSDVVVDTEIPENNTSEYFYITKNWRTVTIQIAPNASQIVKSAPLTLSLKRHFDKSESTQQPFDIDMISIKKMSPVGTLTFECDETPTEDLTANVVILGG